MQSLLGSPGLGRTTGLEAGPTAHARAQDPGIGCVAVELCEAWLRPTPLNERDVARSACPWVSQPAGRQAREATKYKTGRFDAAGIRVQNQTTTSECTWWIFEENPHSCVHRLWHQGGPHQMRQGGGVPASSNSCMPTNKAPAPLCPQALASSWTASSATRRRPS